jgi:hypothetical protein
MSLRTAQAIVNAGTAPALTAATASDTMAVTPTSFARYVNTSSGSVTVTAITPGTLATGVAYPDTVYTLAAGNVTPTEVWIPLLKEYQDPTNGNLATITTSSQTGVTMAVITR